MAMVVFAGGGGLLVGRATVVDSSDPSHHDSGRDLPVVSKVSLGTPHGPARLQGALPVGFTHDKAGALACAAVAGETLIDYVQIRRVVAVKTWLATYASGDLSAASLQRIYDWDPKRYGVDPNRRPTDLPPQVQPPAATEIQPVGFKVAVFTSSNAHVQVWFNGIGWSQGSDYPNTVVNRTADVELGWSNGGWKITSYTAVHGFAWDGPSLDDGAGAGFAPWPGGQITILNG